MDIPFVWVERMDLDTRSEIDLEARRKSPDLVGDLLRFIQEYRQIPEKIPELTEMLSLLHQDRRGALFLHSPDEKELMAILDQAESLCMEYFLKGEMQ